MFTANYQGLFFILSNLVLLILDLPVDQECEYASKEYDSAKDSKLRPLSYDNSSKNLSSKFEFKSKSNALSKVESYILIFFEPFYEALNGSKDKNYNAE